MRKLISAVFAAFLLFSTSLYAADPVNVNTADAATIAKALNGVGLKKAEAIVAYRAAHGPFKNVDELVRVDGIGKATVEKVRANVKVK
jgi:competence protein ComEA